MGIAWQYAKIIISVVATFLYPRPFMFILTLIVCITSAGALGAAQQSKGEQG